MPSPEAMGGNGPDRVTLPEIAGLSRSRKGEICYTPEQTKNHGTVCGTGIAHLVAQREASGQQQRVPAFDRPA